MDKDIIEIQKILLKHIGIEHISEEYTQDIVRRHSVEVAVALLDAGYCKDSKPLKQKEQESSPPMDNYFLQPSTKKEV